MSVESDNEVLVPREVEVDFQIGKVDLNSLLSALRKGQKTAVTKLEALMGSTDEKIALQAAKTFLEFNVDVAKTISADQLTRAIAQAKLQGGGPKMLEREMPKFDPDTIQDV